VFVTVCHFHTGLKFADKVKEPTLRVEFCKVLHLLANIRLGRKWMILKNTLVYCCTGLIVSERKNEGMTEREKGRKGEREKGRKGEREKGRKGEREKGRKGEREKGKKKEILRNKKNCVLCYKTIWGVIYC
jgi:hypothetical protein